MTKYYVKANEMTKSEKICRILHINRKKCSN